MPAMESPGILTTLLAFVLVLGPLVFIHEFGHYIVGRWFGVKADVFSIGFGTITSPRFRHARSTDGSHVLNSHCVDDGFSMPLVSFVLKATLTPSYNPIKYA